METTEKTKFCKHCGEKIPFDAIICVKCGRQVEQLQNPQPYANINNNVATVTSPYVPYKREINKWIALLLCIFTGFGHKFYEGKIGMGILYIFTLDLLGIGWLIDIITILCKPNPYYV